MAALHWLCVMRSQSKGAVDLESDSGNRARTPAAWEVVETAAGDRIEGTAGDEHCY